MKKMMIIAVMIGALLMPAQVSAQNAKAKRGDKKVQMDNRKGGSRDVRKNDKGFQKKKGDKKPIVMHKHRPAPRPVIVHKHRPAPRPVVIHEHCHNDVAAGAAVVIGAAALLSLLAN